MSNAGENHEPLPECSPTLTYIHTLHTLRDLDTYANSVKTLEMQQKGQILQLGSKFRIPYETAVPGVSHN